MSPTGREDAEDLVVRAALGEELTAPERRRIDADPELRAAVAEFAEIIRTARQAPPDDATGRTLDRLWSGIAAQTFGEAGDQEGPGSPVATVALEPVGPAVAAPVEGRFLREHGAMVLRLDISDLPSRDDGFHEVRLLDAERGRRVSLGPARPDGTYVLPAGVAPLDFPEVDVAVVPRDGAPAPAAASVLRGRVRGLA